jgi:hypothetical protein
MNNAAALPAYKATILALKTEARSAEARSPEAGRAWGNLDNDKRHNHTDNHNGRCQPKSENDRSRNPERLIQL